MDVTIRIRNAATQPDVAHLLQEALKQMGAGTPAEGYPNAGHIPHSSATLDWHRA